MVQDKTKFNFEKILLLGLGVVGAVWLRLFLLKYPGYSFDINTFLYWSENVRTFGILELYSIGLSPSIDYPPLIPYLTNIWMQSLSFVSQSQVYIFKLLPTLAEIILMILALFIIGKSNLKSKVWLMLFVILQPATAFVTSGWGQVDSILTLAIVIAFMLIETNLYLSSLTLVIAIMIKPQVAIAIFFYLFWLIFKKGFKNFFIQVAFSSIILLIIYAVFLKNGSNLLPIFTESASRYPYISMNAYNFWWMLHGQGAFSMSDVVGEGVTAKVQGLALFCAFLAPAIYFTKVKAKNMADLFLVTAYAYLIFFTFLTQMHERYLYPAVALLPFAYESIKRPLALYLILSATLLLNCFVVLESVFPQFGFVSQELLTGNWTKYVGLVNVLVATYMGLRLIERSITK